MSFNRDSVRARLDASLRNGASIVASGAGIGLTAKFAAKGGADLIVVYNSGRYRMGGLSSWCGHLPIGDANAIVLEMGEREILPVTKDTPVIAGVFPSDPTRDMRQYLNKVEQVGFSGVINFPTVALIEGAFRDNLETTGLGFACDVELIRLARMRDLFTMAYVFDADQAKAMADAGVDCIVAHMGNTAGGSVGQHGGVPPMERAVSLTREIATAAWSIDPTVYVLCHGGPIAGVEDAQHVISAAGVDGFVGASSVERLPVEKPLQEVVTQFKSLPPGRSLK